jgi:hypothetical protein
VYIFVEKNTLSEYATWKLNKNNKNVKYQFVDDVRVYEFIDNLYALPQNNPIQGFETSSDITEHLRFQWAGLFQRFLQDQQRVVQMKVIEEMNSTAKTLRDLVTILTEEREGTSKAMSDAIKDILIVNHPAFLSFAKAVDASYRVFFTTVSELDLWLRSRGWTVGDPSEWDHDSVREWLNTRQKKYVKLLEDIFDGEGRLKPMTPAEWDDSWIQVVMLPVKPAEADFGDEDIPF